MQKPNLISSVKKFAKENNQSDIHCIKLETTLSLLSWTIVPPGQLWDAFQGCHRILQDKRKKVKERCSGSRNAVVTADKSADV